MLKRFTFTHKTLFWVMLTITSGLFLSACLPGTASAPDSPTPNDTTTTTSSTTEKSGFTTLTGTLQTTSDNVGLLQTGTGPVGVESYAVTLGEYQGQKVTVTGKYSGDTLFVSEITPAE